jgi:D-sedoheptulose 7-phosphate isomerase
MDIRERIKQELGAAAQSVQLVLADTYGQSVAQAVALLGDCFRAGRKVLLFGNGGSAADAQHIAAELIGRYKRERRPLAAIALTTDTSILTAWSNDYQYDTVFARQLEGLGTSGDVAFGISTSGNSRNVVLALQKAKQMGLKTVGLTGRDGGEIAGIVDCSINVPARETARIQEAHIITYHVICEMLDQLTVA